MTGFTKGLDLCEAFFNEIALPIINRHFPNLKYSAGLIGYGSDVLGYDDAVSTDHMWGPRFYMFLSEEDIGLKESIMECFEGNLPYEYKGYSVNFSKPDPNDNGVRHAEFISDGKVSPLIWINTVTGFIDSYLGGYPQNNADWLALSEHRLLGFTSGRLFADMLGMAQIRKELSFYPADVRLYLIASQWALIAEEQAFVKRCGDCGDEIGARIICSRIAERLMRLCFLYKGRYAPYSKWFGTGFKELMADDRIYNEIDSAIRADSSEQREAHIVSAQALVAGLHNQSGVAGEFKIQVQNYFSRNIKVIYADRIADAVQEKIADEALKNIPLIGSLSQIGNLTGLSDNPGYIRNIKSLYKPCEYIL